MFEDEMTECHVVGSDAEYARINRQEEHAERIAQALATEAGIHALTIWLLRGKISELSR